MAGFIQNILWSSVSGFVDAGKRSAGEYAGNALIKAGDAIENGGRGVGNSIEKKATGYGTSISGQTYHPSPKALPSTARKAVVKRSNSVPAGSKVSAVGKSVPVGANKYPGGKQVNNTTKKASSTLGTGAKSVVGTGQKALLNTPSSFKPPARSASLPRSYPADKKTVVKPGQPKPFTPPVEQKKRAYPGQGSRTPVQNQKPKYTPLPRLGPQVGKGETMSHLAV
ncbi:hypothetical protein HBI25_165000 [Parastagonospora nodorum]|nr:hypothetical protein HBH52_010840 [Parastagonospora nodorum]KAH4151480.1 hypothetical protein HBH43_241370 [Parastagonospora nodorum]KAH4254701.1 hypothetical protein HBI03_181210 [Parastagonospora nodorum]KAH4282751.1 hypothetical protein HBI04_014160 [Parastagonospora nodorum]KAH4606284.1 hypothetical protein HBH82_107060 [Parastagonospora nodorum]